VMSSECFYEWTEPGKLSDGFLPIFDIIHVVVYLRPQIDWITSVYKQLVKDDFFKYTGSVFELPQLQLLKYYEILRQWEWAFGKGSVLVRPYFSDGSFNVILDFLDVIGANHISSEADSPENIFENKSIPSLYIEMLKDINRFPVLNENRDRLIQLLQNQNSSHECGEETSSQIDAQALAEVVDIDNTKLFDYFFQGNNPWSGDSNSVLKEM